MTYSKKEAKEILSHLLTIENEINALLADGAENNRGKVSSQSLTIRLKTLKDTIQNDAKRLRNTPTKKIRVLQAGFLRPALYQAFTHFKMRANTTPFTRRWSRGLNDVLSVIVYHREKVEQYIADL